MTVNRLPVAIQVVLLFPLLVALASCNESGSSETVRVSLRNVDVYQYPTAGGDEDGARISSQASHYRVSEIRCDAQTNWVATYVYQPVAGFFGADYAEIEILTGSDGAGPPTTIKRVVFRFDVHH